MLLTTIPTTNFLLLSWYGTADGSILQQGFDNSIIFGKTMTIKAIRNEFYGDAATDPEPNKLISSDALLTADLTNRIGRACLLDPVNLLASPAAPGGGATLSLKINDTNVLFIPTPSYSISPVIKMDNMFVTYPDKIDSVEWKIDCTFRNVNNVTTFKPRVRVLMEVILE